MKKPGKFALIVLLFSGTITVMAGSIVSPVLNLIREGLGIEPAAAGLIITLHGLLVAIFSPLVGILIDRIGAKRPFIFGLILYGLAGGSGLFINDYALLLVSRAALGIGVAFIYTSITVMILNLYQGMARNSIMGWRSSANNLGGVIWPLVGGFLGAFSWHLPFAIYLLGILMAALAFFILPDVKPQPAHAGKDDTGYTLLKVFRGKPVLFAIYGLMFFTMVNLYSITVFLPQLLAEQNISNPVHIGLFLAASSLSGGLTAIAYGKVRSFLSLRNTVLLSLALWAVGFLMLSQVKISVLIVLSIVLCGMGRGLMLPTVMIWTGETVPLSFRGRATSYLGTFGFIGQFLSPIILGPVVAPLGLGGVFLVTGMTAVLFFIGFLIKLKPQPIK